NISANQTLNLIPLNNLTLSEILRIFAETKPAVGGGRVRRCGANPRSEASSPAFEQTLWDF
ncbi:MAG: hypothetical protein K2K30_09580, partial [Alistipes sp.]|nr:hypothetical protein [Alistipes sp.]